MSEARAAAVVLALGFTAGFGLWYAYSQQEINDLDAGHPAEVDVPPPLSTSPRREYIDPTPRLEAGVQFLSPADAGPIEDARTAPEPATASASAGVLPRDLAPGMLPTAEGLYASTVDLWSQAEFLQAIGATHLDLPTYGDCALAMNDRCTLELLTRSQALQITLGIIGQTPDERRGEEFRRSLETTERLAAEAERDLMRRLDQCSGYGRWTEMHERYAEWSR